jgi:hypothetical protein
MKDYINNSRQYLIYFILLPALSLCAQENLSPPLRAHHSLIYDETTKTVLLTGGSTPLNGGSSFKVYNDVWSFNGNKWILKGNAGDERSSMALAYDTKRKIFYSFGGYTNDGPRSEFRIFENNDWKDLPEIPGVIAGEPGLVYDSQRDRLITFGGSSGPGKINSDTWEWDGKEWKKFEGKSPDGRQSFAMVYDESRKKTILYGGVGATRETMYDETWEYDGKSWQKIPVTGPGPRVSSGYAYDSDKKILILFGGMTKNGFVNDTWSYNGKEWKKLSSEGPRSRAMGYMAYDKERKKVVMFGGRLGWPNDANDTWEWDGSQWKEINF